MSVRTPILLLLILLSVSCTLQKRHYRDGYYIHWNKKSNSFTERTKVNETHSKPFQSEIESLRMHSSEDITLKALQKKNSLSKKKKLILHPLPLTKNGVPKIKIPQKLKEKLRSSSHEKSSGWSIAAFACAIGFLIFACLAIYAFTVLLTSYNYLLSFLVVPFSVMGLFLSFFIGLIMTTMAFVKINNDPEENGGAVLAWVAFGILLLGSLALVMYGILTGILKV